MNKKAILDVQKDILEHFPKPTKENIEEIEIRTNVLRFLEHYDEHLKILMEYETERRNSNENYRFIKQNCKW